jgi:hypothetical protein
MHRRLARVLGVALVLVAGPATAVADGWSLHGLANLRVAWTDNVYSVPDEPTPERPQPKEGDVYTQITPGVLFTWEKPRLIQEYFAELDANLYATHREAHSLTYRAGWRGFFLTSPLSELNAGVQAAAGELNTFATLGASQDGTTVLLPSTESQFRTAEARQSFSVQLSRPLRLTQHGFAQVFSVHNPESDTTSTGYLVGSGLGVDRAWRFDAVGLQSTLSYASLDDGASQQLNGSLVAQWRRDITHRWSTVVDGGVTALFPLEEMQERVVSPTVGAQVGYVPEWGSAGLVARRTVVPNVVINANTINDFVVANAYLPLPWFAIDPAQPRLTFGASGGAGRTIVLDPATNADLSEYYLFHGDVSVHYAIGRQMHVGVRYQYLRQEASEDTLTNIPDYDRQTVMVSFYARWPERVAAEVPLRSSLRVDRSDVTSVGEEQSSDGAPAPQR